jgi:uncharacterized membrane protein YhiD involved in acid resistance
VVVLSATGNLKRMYVLAVVAVVIIAGLLYLLDRALKAIQTGRRRRDLAVRMAAATAYAEEQAELRKEAQKEVKESSAELTSVLPSIQQPDKGPRRVA